MFPYRRCRAISCLFSPRQERHKCTVYNMIGNSLPGMLIFYEVPKRQKTCFNWIQVTVVEAMPPAAVIAPYEWSWGYFPCYSCCNYVGPCQPPNQLSALTDSVNPNSLLIGIRVKFLLLATTHIPTSIDLSHEAGTDFHETFHLKVQSHPTVGTGMVSEDLQDHIDH